jgi:DNA helicase-2/ATP-dependent DNA helicase PcrA
VALISDDLLPDWSEAVTYRGGPLLVYGSPGSGKTSLIEQRFCWLVAQGARPERLVVLAPSAGRADALRARLERRLQRGYEELFVLTAVELASVLLGGLGTGLDLLGERLSSGDRLAMLVERIDELPLRHHDFGGSANALLGGFVRRIDRLKAELIAAEDYAAWAVALPGDGAETPLEREFAEVYRAHERMLGDAGARDDGDLIRDALRLARERGGVGRFEQVLLDDAHELDLGPASLARAVAGQALTATGDPDQALRRFRGAGAARMSSFETPQTRVLRLECSRRCPPRMLQAGAAVLGAGPAATSAGEASPPGEIAFWRCANDRAQAQSVAADIERLIAREGVTPGQVAVLVSSISREGRAVSVALEERAVPNRLVGEAAFFQRAEIRDVLAWLRLLADPSDAGAVVRALARPPTDLRSVDIARCTQIARRR